MPEEQVVQDAMDEEIFEAVQKMCHAKENMEINGGDDDKEAAPQEPKPTRKGALQAISTLRKYLEYVDGSCAQKLELGLAIFGWETFLEASKELFFTSITDYFVSK
ncbi:hypothetical protein B0H17DRAFT_1137491 [Mycena rosella]|uniref:Uncharacterized protein n=1 Tax=Mycena rosella TaxID=1033263 RepID=A0AAD7D8Y6_MYCRO|nr:hypothetical protein B0H17DRAFT_1137491 [Mycena rosella]